MALTGASLGAVARQARSLPRVPGARIAEVPRQPEDRPAEVSVAIDPNDARHVLVAYQQVSGVGFDHAFGVRVEARVAWSADAGQSWTVAGGTSHPDYLRSLDASVAIDRHGHAFLGFLAIDSIGTDPVPAKNTGAGHNGVFVRRSEDGGRTWDPRLTALADHRSMTEGRFEDKGFLVADNGAASPHGGNLYLGWTSYSLEKSEILFARSTDDGKTWSTAASISTEPGPRESGAGAPIGFHAAVGPDGTVYAIWAQGRSIALAVSRDGGRSFEPSRPVLETTVVWPLKPAHFAFVNGFPSIAVDPRGRLYLTWGDSRFGDLDILASTSADGGRTWSAPVRVNDDDRRNGRDQIQSWVAVDPADGAAYVMFYDRRADRGNVRPTVTLARSVDGGHTFVNYAWTVAPSDPRRARYGDYNGLAALGGRVYGAWIENAPGARSRGPAQYGPAVVKVGIAAFGGAN